VAIFRSRQRVRLAAFGAAALLALAPLADAAAALAGSPRQALGCHTATEIQGPESGTASSTAEAETTVPSAPGHAGCHGAHGGVVAPEPASSTDGAAGTKPSDSKEVSAPAAGKHRCDCHSVPTLTARPCRCGGSSDALAAWPDLRHPGKPAGLPCPDLVQACDERRFVATDSPRDLFVPPPRPLSGPLFS
jgi:hypothetical protein